MRFLIGFLLLITAFAGANDAVVTGIGGRWNFMDGEHSQVQMVREKVQITIGDGELYRVVADFVFRNRGPRTVVTMGFPESGGGDIDSLHLRHKTAFKNFQSWVDNRNVRLWRAPAHTTENTYEAFWIKKVGFAAHQTRRVRVSYQAPLGVAVGGPKAASYVFTGKNWLGEVEESVLIVDFLRRGTFAASDDLARDESVRKARRGNHFVYRWNHWQASTTFDFNFMKTVPGWLQISAWNMDLNINNGPKTSKTQGADFLPAALLRDGTTLISLRKMAEILSVHERMTLGTPEKYLIWNRRSNALNLNSESHSFGFLTGRKTMQLDEKQSIVLPMAPLKLTSRNAGQSETYVPLRPLLKVLGADAKVDAKGRALRIMWPVYTAKK